MLMFTQLHLTLLGGHHPHAESLKRTQTPTVTCGLSVTRSNHRSILIFAEKNQTRQMNFSVKLTQLIISVFIGLFPCFLLHTVVKTTIRVRLHWFEHKNHSESQVLRMKYHLPDLQFSILEGTVFRRCRRLFHCSGISLAQWTALYESPPWDSLVMNFSSPYWCLFQLQSLLINTRFDSFFTLCR